MVANDTGIDSTTGESGVTSGLTTGDSSTTGSETTGSETTTGSTTGDITTGFNDTTTADLTTTAPHSSTTLGIYEISKNFPVIFFKAPNLHLPL